MYYKLGQTSVINWGSVVLLQISANVVANWGSFIVTNKGKCCYKLGQPLLQYRVTITNWGKMYYKLGQVLQIRAIITNWGITTCCETISPIKSDVQDQSKFAFNLAVSVETMFAAETVVRLCSVKKLFSKISKN